MQTNEDYMRQAIETAIDSKNRGGVAIGAVLVDDATGEVVATGGSQVGPAKDPTAHAEINCIRAAARQIGSDDLFGLTLFSTLEPCHMCLSASAWARIPRIFFGAYRKDVDETLFDIKGDFSDEQEGKRMNLRENLTMSVIGGVLEDECAHLLAEYHELPKHAHIIV
ncbi:MAG TPA: nucleoside deaminase [Candidatus Saccharimonadales bacterium]|jgi:tRNA(Arg) A34 adenosine deaminase TadA|nr:nucleoside deaminase [Candidatus Saccharimonadales bacterium]